MQVNGLGDSVDDFDAENSRIAHAVLNEIEKQTALRICPDARAAVETTRPPCRFEHFEVKEHGKSVPVILDVAHNEVAMRMLVKSCARTHPVLAY